MDKMKCLLQNVIQEQDCKFCDSKKCEKQLRKIGTYYTTSGFIQYANKTLDNK
jgi:hypothetical protein